MPRSPEIHSDRTVTFRLYAPETGSAYLMAAGLANIINEGKPLPMSKTDSGLFEITVGPLEPDIYDYGFSIGGSHRTIDIVNPNVETLKWGQSDIFKFRLKLLSIIIPWMFHMVSW